MFLSFHLTGKYNSNYYCKIYVGSDVKVTTIAFACNLPTKIRSVIIVSAFVGKGIGCIWPPHFCKC